MEEVESRKEGIDSNIDTKDTKVGRNTLYIDVVIHVKNGSV